MSCRLRWGDMSLIVPSSPPCLSRMILGCVGEFTVCCNLIPNKVTQQILLTQMDATASLWEGSSDSDTMSQWFLYSTCRLGSTLSSAAVIPLPLYRDWTFFSLLHPASSLVHSFLHHSSPHHLPFSFHLLSFALFSFGVEKWVQNILLESFWWLMNCGAPGLY